ncbi:SIMPL domain-containing protein [Nocardia sp. NPDC004068]|uniref:SIMPL domain-containing protein n=1 Tax=Nocardia sp. NPDC004068 TaxID=3364303 RepID=UPI00368DBF08
MANERSEGAGTVTVVGYGRASAVPDRMRVTVSVETRASTVALAYRHAGERAGAVTEALRAQGVSGADIATTGLSVHTETTWVEGGGSRITGYVASTALTIGLRTDAGVDPAVVIGHAVEAGGDDVRLGGLDLAVSDREGLLARARDAAWDDALAKAEQFAGRAGLRVGGVVSIAESGGGASPPPSPVAFVAAKVESAVPVEYGESEVSASVQVTWRLR